MLFYQCFIVSWLRWKIPADSNWVSPELISHWWFVVSMSQLIALGIGFIRGRIGYLTVKAHSEVGFVTRLLSFLSSSEKPFKQVFAFETTLVIILA